MEQQNRTREEAIGTVSGMEERKLQEARDNQNLSMGAVGGIAAAAVGAVIWAIITIATGYQIGWMAIGVGFLVGYAVKLLGKGVDPVFGYAGAAIALAGCIIGNLLTVVIMVSRQESLEVLTVLSRLTPGLALDILKETFQPMDVLFYGLAVYEAYKISFTKQV
ncbi:MAG: hypothetical protein AABZ15_05560 [Nitrospirota bacterium]